MVVTTGEPVAEQQKNPFQTRGAGLQSYKKRVHRSFVAHTLPRQCQQGSPLLLGKLGEARPEGPKVVYTWRLGTLQRSPGIAQRQRPASCALVHSFVLLSAGLAAALRVAGQGSAGRVGRVSCWGRSAWRLAQPLTMAALLCALLRRPSRPSPTQPRCPIPQVHTARAQRHAHNNRANPSAAPRPHQELRRPRSARAPQPPRTAPHALCSTPPCFEGARRRPAEAAARACSRPPQRRGPL
mgnify:CR=1 FL=1